MGCILETITKPWRKKIEPSTSDVSDVGYPMTSLPSHNSLILVATTNGQEIVGVLFSADFLHNVFYIRNAFRSFWRVHHFDPADRRIRFVSERYRLRSTSVIRVTLLERRSSLSKLYWRVINTKH